MTARNRTTRKAAKPRVGKYIAIVALMLVIAGIAASVSATYSLAMSWLKDLPDYSDSDAYLLAEPTQVLDADGNVIAQFYMENRTPITKEQCSQYVLWATVDTEDERFYEHNGVDIKGILRAVVAQLSGGSEGASTITQQLVRNTVLSDEQFEQTLSRKVREAYIATQLEQMYSKDDILMMYLNSIYYGAGCYGIEAAAQTYFGKSCADLTIAEAATLAGLPQSPSYYNPLANPESAIERRNVVLAHLLDKGHITQQEYDEAVASDLVLNYTPPEKSGAYAYPYFVDYVKSTLSTQFSTDVIFKGGLTVKTTISPKYQQAAENAVWSVLQYADDELESALVCIDPNTGYILAMVGGRDYNADQFNLATMARRQPGSSFKVFTLTAAIQAGMNPTVLANGNSGIMVGDWKVNNYQFQSYGNISLRQATYLSCNSVYAQVINEIGVQNVIDTAYAMGITTDLSDHAYNSLTLGTAGCSVLEMASAYGTLATGGVHYDTTCITEVLDRNGNSLYKYEPVGTQAVSPEVAGAVTDILEGVVSFGTGTEAQPYVNQPVAGKTGTTDDTRDLWFVGYTPQISVAVWVGYRTETEIWYQGSLGSTHTLPSPIFSHFVTEALQDEPRAEFPAAGSPVYRDNYSWSFSQGTWVEPTEEETTEEGETTDENGNPTGDGTTSGDGTSGDTSGDGSDGGNGGSNSGDGDVSYDDV